MKNREDFEDQPIMGLIQRLQTYWVDWFRVTKTGAPSEDPAYDTGLDFEESNLDHANVVSSLVKQDLGDFAADPTKRFHKVAIDLDIPAYLIPSSTPGHSHLYIDVDIPHHRYMALLSALADAGIIERGYADVSIKRGRSDLRLPWVEKGDATPERPKHPLPVHPDNIGVPPDDFSPITF